MKKFLFLFVLILGFSTEAFAQSYTLSGVVLDKESGKPVEFATVLLTRTEQWAVADEKGSFTISKIQQGTNEISISCLGYVTETMEISITKDIPVFQIYLKPDNLTLDSVVITAQENENSATTSRTIDRTALDHIQMVNVADISGLLPGGQTVDPNLTAKHIFNIRAGATTEMGNASFGTAVEVDGVRLSNNASFGDIRSGVKGVTTNNIASSNVESVEVITGVPSVEYGDMTSGIVKVNTKKGKTPYMITMSTNPNTKQFSLSKGFGLGNTRKGASKGVLNSSIEYTKSISDLVSPYTSYDRKQLTLTYSNTFNNGILSAMPLRFSVGATGNLGGMDSSADPDTFKDTFDKGRDNAIRGNFSLNWLLSRSWITNLELNGSVSYSDKRELVRTNYSSSSSTVALHGTSEGYFVGKDYSEDPDAAIIMIPPGYWYNTMGIDDRPLNYKIALKANWAKQLGKINNKIKIGADWSGDGNFGIGEYSEDFATAPTFREWRYCDVPFMNNLAAYIEDNITIPIGKTRLNIIAGLRNDNTFIRNSVYGTTSSLSPRFNMKYTIFSPKDRRKNTVKELSFRGSWGMAVKQPSFSILYPEPSYNDIQTFSPTSASDASAYYAYYILPRTIEYNPALKWQRNNMSEIGMDIDIDGYRISLAGYYNRTTNAYYIANKYDKFAYNYTNTNALESCPIPVDNRGYNVDNKTGIVTVYDKTGALPSYELAYTTKERFSTGSYASNSPSPITRYGLEWIIDFKRIKPINTTIRLDGSFYSYYGLETEIRPYYAGNWLMSDSSPYRYIGYYIEDSGSSNGRESRSINTNLTITTHIPSVRMIISMKIEASLLSYNRYLSEGKNGEQCTYVISDKNDILSIQEGASIYDGEHYTVTFPLYYTSYDDPTPRNYLEDLKAARQNDPVKYNDLSKMATVNNFLYYFKKDYISPYFSANLSVTKEIGDIASISFYANNFFNNLGQVYSSRSGTYSSVMSYVPAFYYGLSLRLKF